MFRNIFTINWLYSIIDYFFFIKLKIINIYAHYFIDNDFKLNNATLYTDLTNNYDVSYYFKKHNINKIDVTLIKNIYNNINLNYLDSEEDARLKLDFRYINTNYILYYSLKKQIFKDINESGYFIPYPPYNDEIISNYRKSIIYPNYNFPTKHSILYPLFMIDSKDISNVELTKDEDNNNNNNNKLLEYFNKIKTPFNDFGLLYHCPVKVKWILRENNISENNFKNLYIKFFNMYFDENILDLKEHYIDIKNINDVIISNRMYSEIVKKNNEILKEFEDLNK